MLEDELRIGVTMRVVRPMEYNEPRDALAHNWIPFLQTAFPRALWMPLVNCGPSIVDQCRQWGINALILSGGETPGEEKTRDMTERALLEWASERQIPVLGICRGMQMMGIHAGEELVAVHGHVKTRHRLRGEISREVNSYHAMALTAVPRGFETLAADENGCVEAIRSAELPWEGWMWHPEREVQIVAEDRNRARALFLGSI